ncbi:MAG: hypothetical protein Q4A74_08815 [Cardiobacteriaceae bacterium]|nr:hypothetical protein [Cardiobacteriaceae bacterium]
MNTLRARNFLLSVGYPWIVAHKSTIHTNLKTQQTAGVEYKNIHDAGRMSLNLSSARLSQDNKTHGKEEKIGGIASNDSNNEEAARSAKQSLNDKWQRNNLFGAFDGTYPKAIRIIRWKTKSKPKRYYGIFAWQQSYTALNGSLQGRRYHYLVDTFSCLNS